jgi:hypothetical protein
MYIISRYLNFLKDAPTFISYISLDVSTLNYDHKIEIILFMIRYARNFKKCSAFSALKRNNI